MESVLNYALLLPLIGAILIWSTASFGRNFARMAALMFTVATLVLVAWLTIQFPANGEVGSGFAVTDVSWLGDTESSINIRYHVGLDGLSIWMFGLSALLMVTSVLVSWEAITDRAPWFYGMLLLLECGCLGVFVARDIILFYVFFEFTLIPLFFLIGIWGSEERRYAAMKFFVYTLAGSVLTFLGLLAIVWWDAIHNGTGVLRFSMADLTNGLRTHPIEPAWLQMLIFLALFAGFAIKVPLFPLHTWLPLAHVQAPTAGSVILAGVLLKIGTYGFLRFSMAMLPEASVACMPLMLWLAVIGIVYGALVALAQGDIKRLIAYSSVSHLGFCMLGLFAFNPIGLAGGTLQMVNHGLSTGGLFALVGMIYERYHTREIRHFGGLARRLPWLAFFMVVFTLSSIGLPGLNGFVGEFMVLLGAFQRAWTGSPLLWQSQFKIIAVLAVTGVVLGAWYMLWLVQRVFFGPVLEPHGTGDGAKHGPATDMCWREVLALVPLTVFVVWIGLQPKFFLDRMQPSLRDVNKIVDASLQRRIQADETAAQSAPHVAVLLRNTKAESSTASTQQSSKSATGSESHRENPRLVPPSSIKTEGDRPL